MSKRADRVFCLLVRLSHHQQLIGKGVIIHTNTIIKDGQCLGAVGVSGVKSNEDAQIAKAGIAAIGL